MVFGKNKIESLGQRRLGSMVRFVLAAAFCFSAIALLSTGCGSGSCGTGECAGSDGVCYGPCIAGTVCTTKPSGNCSAPSAGGVYCCGGGGGGGGGGCTARVCCGGLYECNGRCYSTCTPGSQPCCTGTNCTCYTPCC